jgi:hypothetical protein
LTPRLISALVAGFVLPFDFPASPQETAKASEVF